MQPIDVGGGIVVDSLSPTYLKPPTPSRTILRAAFLVDMSASMQAGACPNSVETWVSQDVREQDCSSATGVDTLASRLEIIKKWIQEAEQSLVAMGINDPEALKVLIVPFSNGSVGPFYAMGSGRPNYEKFYNAQQAELLLLQLKTIQRCYTESCSIPPELAGWNWSTARSQGLTSTSVPGPALIDMKTIVNTEIQRLKSLNLLASSQFEFVFLSDGVAQPQVDHIKEVSKKIWVAAGQSGCVSSCMGDLTNYILNPGGGISTPCLTCLQKLNNYQLVDAAGGSTLLNRISVSWGSFPENTMEMIFLRLHQIRMLFLQNPEANFRFSFVRVDSPNPIYRLSNYETDASRNWIEKAKSIYASGTHRHTVISSPTAPFSLFSNISGGQAYAIQSLFITNLNVRAILPNSVAADSDGDGLTDAKEASLGTNPLKARTNGVCLDSIVMKTGSCITAFCDPQIDQDHDGLNQCEEKTLGTSDYDVDTDGDGIPDSMEVILGYNPLSSDRIQDSNTDGVSNFLQFQMGLGPMANLDLYNPIDWVHYRIEFAGYAPTTIATGQTLYVGGYRIGFQVPYRNTKHIQDTVKSGFQFIGINQPANTNTILIYAKIQNTQNAGDYYWIGKRIQVNSFMGGPVNLDLSTMDILNVLDPTLEVQ